MNNASDEYLRNAVLTATPEQLHLMLYDGALRFARQGIDGLKRKNWEDSFNGFSRAQKIILEMLNSLKPEVDRALCSRMASLYNFIYRKLVDASIQRNATPAEEAIKILEYQRETWVLVIEKLRKERAGPAPSPSRRQPPSQPELAGAVYGSLSVEG